MCDLFVICLICTFIIMSVVFVYTMEVWRRLGVGRGGEEEYIEFFEEEPQPPKCKVAVALLMRRPIDLPIWFKHHRKLGVSRFYIRLEDSPGWEDYLESQRDVDFEISSSDKSGNNYETLMHRQIEFVNKSLKKAAGEGVDWIFHIDCDELLHGSLAMLDDLDAKYRCVRLKNAEAVFKEDEDTCFSAVKFLKCSDNAPCRSYVNGKGGGRVEEGVALAGPHHFSYRGAIQGGNVYEVPFEKLHVLHFDSCSFGAWAEKFKHLGHQKKDNVPFPYYRESIEVAVQAFDVYKKHNMKTLQDIPEELVYVIDRDP